VYGSQVWGTVFLQAGREISTAVYASFAFSEGHVRCEAIYHKWAVLRECGHELLQFYWFRSAVKLFNGMLISSLISVTLRRVVQDDLNLHTHSSACWTPQLLSAFRGLRGCESYVRAVQTGRAIPMQEFSADLKHTIQVLLE